jgi:uncharacterized protein (DUF305 family)
MIRISGFLKKFIEAAAPQLFLSILICSTLLGLTACSGSGEVAANRSGSFRPDTSSENQHLEKIYWNRLDSAKMQFSQADADFMVGMIAHHAQALIMSGLAPKNDAGSTIQTLAARIINAQKDEIASIQRWLRERNQPVPKVHIDGLILTITMEPSGGQSAEHQQHSHSDHSGMDHSGMPGMLTQDQLNELSELKGDAFDQAFLTYMISHHEGGVVMVKKLFNTDGAAQDHQVYRLASDIQVDQTTEIERMKLMLQNMKDL